MDLIKLQKQLLKEYLGLYPDNFHHNVNIKIEIGNTRDRFYTTFQIHFWSSPVEDVQQNFESHFLMTEKYTSLKKVVLEARNLMLPIDNKPEVETDLKSLKP